MVTRARAPLLTGPGVLVALRLLPAAAAAGVLAISVATTNLIAIASAASLGFAAGSALAALFFARSDVRVHAGVTLAAIAVVIAGLTRTGPPYMIACGVFAAVALFCLRAPLVAARLRAAGAGAGTAAGGSAGASAPRSAASSSPEGRGPVAFVVLGVGAAVTTSLVLALPPAGRAAERFVQRYAGDYADGQSDQIGFAANIRVGSLSRALKSDRVVMRVEGRSVEYLRGAVLDRYDRRVWSSTRFEKTTQIAADAPPERTATRLILSRTALAARTDAPRWFLAEDACDVRTPSGRMKIDGHGIAQPDPPGDAREISFGRASAGGGAGTASACASPLPAPLPPSSNDVAIAEKIRAELTPLAIQWTAGARTAPAALDAMVRELAKFDYSLDDRRESHVDPVVEFLTVNRRGHCEYFASALALLARTVGIPARLVVGYRVDEVNPVTGLGVVRERNAHTWVEAWIDGRWQPYDPTPLVEVRARAQASRWEHVTDALSWGWDRTVAFFVRLGLLGTGVLFAVAAVVLLILRAILQRRRGGAGGVALAASRPLPAYESLAAALARAGFSRAPSEPLERFARRVREAEAPWSSDVASVIGLYAEHRYGGASDEASVAAQLARATRQVGAG